MKLRTQLVTTMLLFCLLLLGVVFSAVVTTREVQRVGRLEEAAIELERQASELRYLSHEFLLYGERQQRIRWEAKFESFWRDLSGLNPDTPEQKAALQNLRASSQRMKAVFMHVAASRERANHLSAAPVESPLFRVSSSRMAVQEQGIFFEALQLSQALKAQKERTNRWNSAVVLSLLGVLGVYYIVTYLLVHRRTLRSISALRAGTSIIGSGNLHHRIGMSGSDEIGQLARAFDQMTEHLQAVTVSKEALLREIEERERAQEELRSSRELLAVTLASIGDGVIVTDLDGCITFINPEAQRLTGWAGSGALGQPLPRVFEIVHEHTRRPAENPVEKVLRLGSVVGLADHTLLLARDGRGIPIDDSGAPVRGADGALRGVVLVFRDSTEKKEAEDRLRRAVDEAEAANRAKSDFLARMSHEIRTPMNGIMGMTELALMEEGLPQRAREFLGLSRQSAKGLLEIINDILDIARIEAGRAELTEKPFDLGASVGDLLVPLRVTAESKGLRLHYRLGDEVPALVSADEGRLRQVLTNLIGNAVKFTEHGEVEVTAQPSGEPAAPGRVRLLFAIRDTGIGIAPEDRCMVFDSFSGVTRSTHARYGGTGLGLSIARQLVELMGGRIWVESELGRGSLFQFTAEVGLSEGKEAGPAAADPERAPPGERLRVLLAEDNPSNQLFAQQLLHRLGHSVVLAADGEEAVRVLSRERFDAVLMDVQMPLLDGDAATKRIRAGLDGCPPDVPIIALTAHALEGDRERFLAAGMDDYLSKPFDAEALKEVLRRAVARRTGAPREAQEG